MPPPAALDALRAAPLTAMFTPVTSMVPPVVPLRVPATDSVPEMATVWVGAPTADEGGRRGDPAIEQFREKLGHSLQLVEDSTM